MAEVKPGDRVRLTDGSGREGAALFESGSGRLAVMLDNEVDVRHYHPSDLETLVVEPDPTAIALAFFQSEAALWLSVGSNHTEAWLDVLSDCYKAYAEAGGKTWGKP